MKRKACVFASVFFTILFSHFLAEADVPVLDPIGNKTISEGERLEFTITASDPDGDSLEYSASNLPPGATFDPATQVFDWTPDWLSSGEHKDIIFRVSDGHDYDEEIITIDVIDQSPLEAPRGLVAINGDTHITLNWDPVTETELLAGYNIYRSTRDVGHYVRLNDSPVTNTQYVDQDMEGGTAYSYFVTAVDIFEQVELLTESMNYPLDIASNDKGEIFVTTWISGQVWKIDHDGNQSIYAEGLGSPLCLTFHDEDLFVTDPYEGSIHRITPQREIYPYAESVVLEKPYGIVFDANGDLFVTEDTNGRILKISNNGENWELFFEGLVSPGDMTIDDSGNIYVGEDLWEGVNPSGPINIIDPDQNKQIFVTLDDPDGIFLDTSGILYVSQTLSNEVTKVMPDGSSMPVAILDSGPWGVIVNKFNELIVTSPANAQIIKVHLSHESDISNKVATDPLPLGLIIDNTDPEFSTVGAWYPYTGGLPYYGSNFLVNPSGTGNDQAIFAPDIPIEDNYEVFAWLETAPTGASNCPYTINHADGSTIVRVDLTDSANNGRWISLGTYRFIQGTFGTIAVSDDADGLYVVADAIRLEQR